MIFRFTITIALAFGLAAQPAKDDRRFKRGQAISSPGKLRSWLDRQKPSKGKIRHVRLPVLLTFDATNTAVAAARIGDDPKALEIRVSDAAMGISLADRARQHCPTGGRCALWLEGTWRGGSASLPRFDVLNVVKIVSAEELGTPLYAEVEAQ